MLGAADAGRSTTRSVRRVGGLVRFARVQPLGAPLDVVFGRVITEKVAGLERGRPAVPVRRASTQS